MCANVCGRAAGARRPLPPPAVDVHQPQQLLVGRGPELGHARGVGHAGAGRLGPGGALQALPRQGHQGAAGGEGEAGGRRAFALCACVRACVFRMLSKTAHCQSADCMDSQCQYETVRGELPTPCV